jgi:hypothetical protein
MGSPLIMIKHFDKMLFYYGEKDSPPDARENNKYE